MTRQATCENLANRFYWLAGVAVNGSGALAARAGGLHPPYALVLGYVAALAGDGAIAG
jgi:hypothetical protein